LLALLGPLAPRLAVNNGLKPEWISRDPAIVKAYVDDPLVHDRITPRLARFIVDGGRQVLAAAPRWQVPTLLLWAGADRCVDPNGSAAFAAAAPPAIVHHRRYAPLAHEIFNEPEREEVMGDLVRWLRASRAPLQPEQVPMLE
jgi:alpha-beta hydrolase superfamily lysophospholipase